MEDLTLEYEKTKKRERQINSKLLKVIQDLIWGVYCKEKIKKVLEETNPPKNVAGLKRHMVSTDVWRSSLTTLKVMILGIKIYKILFLKSKNLTCKLIDAFLTQKNYEISFNIT